MPSRRICAIPRPRAKVGHQAGIPEHLALQPIHLRRGHVHAGCAPRRQHAPELAVIEVQRTRVRKAAGQRAGQQGGACRGTAAGTRCERHRPAREDAGQRREDDDQVDMSTNLMVERTNKEPRQHRYGIERNQVAHTCWKAILRCHVLPPPRRA